jgi:hypothetical protein
MGDIISRDKSSRNSQRNTSDLEGFERSLSGGVRGGERVDEIRTKSLSGGVRWFGVTQPNRIVSRGCHHAPHHDTIMGVPC